MRGEACKQGGWYRLSVRRWWFVLALVLVSGGLHGETLSPPTQESSTGWRALLENLRTNLVESREISRTQENRISDLQSEIVNLNALSVQQSIDNGRLTKLLAEQDEGFQTQARTLEESQNGWSAASRSWTNYSESSERLIRSLAAEVKTERRSVRRNRLAWQIGVPAATAAGIIAGVLISRELYDESS